MSRLCLFATPLDVLPFYRENIFPLAEAAGFVPVTAAAVVNLGDSVNAKIDTLIDRAAVMVVDATSPNTQFELGLAASRVQETPTQPNRQTLRLIAVITQLTQLSTSSIGIQTINRPGVLSEDSPFVFELAHLFESLASEMGLAQNLEPRRLFQGKEYRAAVIAAMTLLEATLRQRLNKPTYETAPRLMALRQLLNRAVEENILLPPYEVVFGWMKLRNDAVHTAKPVSRAEAKVVVEGVERILSIGPTDI